MNDEEMGKVVAAAAQAAAQLAAQVLVKDAAPEELDHSVPEIGSGKEKGKERRLSVTGSSVAIRQTASTAPATSQSAKGPAQLQNAVRPTLITIPPATGTGIDLQHQLVTPTSASSTGADVGGVLSQQNSQQQQVMMPVRPTELFEKLGQVGEGTYGCVRFPLIFGYPSVSFWES